MLATTFISPTAVVLWGVIVVAIALVWVLVRRHRKQRKAR
jgi:hypothetical protein